MCPEQIYVYACSRLPLGNICGWFFVKILTVMLPPTMSPWQGFMLLQLPLRPRGFTYQRKPMSVPKEDKNLNGSARKPFHLFKWIAALSCSLEMQLFWWHFLPLAAVKYLRASLKRAAWKPLALLVLQSTANDLHPQDKLPDMLTPRTSTLYHQGAVERKGK